MAPKDLAVSSYVDNLLIKVIRRRPEDCARQFVQRVSKVAQQAIEGAREVASQEVKRLTKATLEKEVAQMENFKATGVAEADSPSSGIDVAVGCARVAVARWVEAAEKAKEAKEVAEGGEGETVCREAVAKIAVGQWVSKATEAASKEGERKVAAACARIAVSRYLEKAKASIESQKEQGWKQHFPEAVKRNESKAFERAVEQGDPREVAAMCARHAVKLYLDQAKETIRGNVSACSAIEQVHHTVVKAASKIAAVTQPTIDDLQGFDCEDEDPASPRKSPMKPSGTAPKKRRPMPKESKLSSTSASAAWDWTAPPSPQQFEADVKKAAAKQKQKNAPRKWMKTDPEEERKRDVELLQKRHFENLQRLRHSQELRSVQNQFCFLHSLVSEELPGSKLHRPPPKAKGQLSWHC